ncbi:MAG TPA: sigma-70 family RNA polymerase sigma factor [Pseudolysinimonas sp.]|jgi:RNA polymerase sigma-70 factor (ECF subfamily)
MDDQLTQHFEHERPRLRAVALRMLGSAAEADDAVQEAWLRLDRTVGNADADAIDNLSAWLTTVVTRVCLNLLRSRRQRAEIPLEPPSPGSSAHVADPVIARESLDDPLHDPERQAVLADSVGAALLVVLDTLGPDERVAFVLHDLFAVPFDEIARMLDRTPASTRQLATRARRRVQGREPGASAAESRRRQRRVVDAFFAAARGGDMAALVAVLHPDIVFRIDTGPDPRRNVEISGASTVAGQAVIFGPDSPPAQPALVNGMPGAVVIVDGRLLSVSAFTLRDGVIVAIDALADPARLAGIDVSVLG